RGIKFDRSKCGVQMVNRGPYTMCRNTTAVAVEANTLRLAETLIDSCEACAPAQAEIPFDHILDVITGCDPESTDYVLPEPARCPRCASAVRTGYWRWYESERDGPKVLILPGTLVTTHD